ncbi:MAG: gliding motility-associated C-terminal domain-containing protein [Bacteroidales bacterium]|nr:gliding motility-associated C-terminal domain-containing protein [Bacteroidales bacterium]
MKAINKISAKITNNIKLRGIIKRFLKNLLLLLLTTFINTAISQTPTIQDCLGAIPVCQDIYIEPNVYSGTGNYPNEIFITPGDCEYDCPGSCMDGEQNSVWYIFTIQEAGLLSFSIIPDVATDDYDWAVYDLTSHECEDIYSQYMVIQSSCNAAGGEGYHGSTGVSSSNGGTTNCNNCGPTNKWNANIPVTEGKTYVLCVSNWMSAGANGGFKLDFSASTAVIYDNIRPEVSQIFSNDITCNVNTLEFKFTENVMCVSVTPTSINLTGPGGPYTITNIYGEACDVGGEMERTYTLTIDPPFLVGGTFSLNIDQYSEISDACGNNILTGQFPFYVDIYPPEINENNLEISITTCGKSNGSITGLSASGPNPFTFEYKWKDAGGNTIGENVDLLNVFAGIYTLTVTDENTCECISGPHQIINVGTPVNVTATANTPPICTEDNLHLNCDFYGADFYFWQGTNGFTSTEQNPVINNVSLSDAGTYTLIAIKDPPYNCSDTSEIEIEIFQTYQMYVSISASESQIFPGDVVEFIASAEGASNDALYNWTVENESWQEGFDSTFISSKIYSTSFVNCIVTSSAPCTFPNPAKSDKILLEVIQPKVFLPNAFNPNSIHGNDKFKVITLPSHLIDFQMHIYTKWGNKIFESTDINNSWDGTINGKPAPIGVYIWVIKHTDFGESNKTGKVITKKGTVTLVR